MALHIAALLLFVVLMPLLALVPMRLLASLSTLRRGSRERAHIARLDGNGSLVVRGILRVEGPLAQPGGASLGAVTIWSSARRFWFRRTKHEGRERAEKLTVVAGDERYELRGAVEVLSGSRTTFEGVPAQPFDRRAYAVRTALSDGDEVIVAGVVTSATEGQKYRDRGATVIEPTVEAQVIFACATKRSATAVPVSALIRHFSVFLLMFVGCYPLYKLAGDYASTDCASACKDFGLCGIESNLKLYPWTRALNKAWEGNHVGCAATSDELCRASTYCGELGQCTAVAGDCIATSVDDCRKTSACLSSGSCSPVDGNCRASADDCRYTRGCIEYGHCEPRDGFCGAATGESCKDTSGCRDYGSCSAVGDHCAAARRDDCATTDGCVDYGRCTPVDGYCKAASDADCRATTQCREEGKCSLVYGECAAKTNDDCRDTRRCSEARECQAKDGRCVADAATLHPEGQGRAKPPSPTAARRPRASGSAGARWTAAAARRAARPTARGAKSATSSAGAHPCAPSSRVKTSAAPPRGTDPEVEIARWTPLLREGGRGDDRSRQHVVARGYLEAGHVPRPPEDRDQGAANTFYCDHLGPTAAVSSINRLVLAALEPLRAGCASRRIPRHGPPHLRSQRDLGRVRRSHPRDRGRRATRLLDAAHGSERGDALRAQHLRADGGSLARGGTRRRGVLVGAPKLAVALEELGLIDEYRIVLHPIISGRGPTLFHGLSSTRHLEFLSTQRFESGAQALHYRRRAG